ncbi:MAG: DUF1573 domain-containing protein [Gemmataceae bacterium]|nr:DUF1573 domain-containing protein [Gemmataceae bacterium]
MRNVVLALGILLSGTATASAQTPEWADKLFAANGGTTSHNFGNVPRGAVFSHKFTMTNIYAVPLQIVSTRVSCGCVTVTPSTQQLQPKEKATIEVTMDARRFTGAKTVSIYISVGPQFTSTATLQVSANSRTDVVFNPGQVTFGVVASGQASEQVIDVEYAGALDWRVTGIAEHSLPLTTRVEELYRQPGKIVKVGYRLHITLKSDAPAGTHRWELLMQTNDPSSPSFPVLVEATIQAPLSVAPSPANFGTVKVGETVTRKVLVRGSKPFTIREVEGQGDGVVVELPSTPAAVQVVTLKWVVGQPGDLKRDLRFKTDLDAGVTATVTVEGKATQ